MEKRYKVMVGVFASVPFLMVLGNSMLIPEFPKIKSALNINQFQVGLMITLFSAAAGLSIPFLGYLSDRYGRKVILIPSLIIYGLGGVVSGITAVTLGKKGYYLILLGRIIQGIGAAGTYPIVIALVGDIFQSEERSTALGIIESANGLGKVLSPLLGAAVALIVWHALFFSYAFLAIPIALAVYFLVQEPKRSKKKESLMTYLTQIKSIFQEKGKSLFFSLLAGITVLFILFGVLSFISDLFETKYKVVGLKKGLILALPILFMSISSYLSGIYLEKKGQYFKHAMALGLFIATIALTILPFLEGLILYLIAMAILGVGNGLVLPALNTLVTSTAASTHRGGITSIYGSSRFLGVAFGPPTFSLLNQISTTVMFITAAVIALTVSLLTFFLVNEDDLLGNQQKEN
ncbi:arabinose efflux permease family protein [Halobacteroides halobius DSM 5150]|uniref:Arabinose efflux permease family protein n=1 Tax=Halobacteroides halobius (strain ATCC 35273 / DSM 5150 / MD-1) TaxID=748449 RepID=L0KAP7_HALHC|nr:MFS transporter [Halobacteroides halobius]AGB41444.1 arabinose efflux permease family protein [Halobacteroides halobius DSM 5150]